MLGKGLELLSVNGGKFEINQLLLADDTARSTRRRNYVNWCPILIGYAKKKVESECR